MVVHEIKSAAQFKEIVDAKKTFVLDCYADWCGPCKAIAPKISSLSEEHAHAEFYKVDVDNVSELAAELGVRAMPSFFFYKDGQKVHDVVGANPKGVEEAVKALA
ncbi:hypothetical protein MW887_002377 [Aspergillus wentii]|nr:hypothetical protein MW887_002377 [Aspergillus wentii]